jgi:hypothetical protein
VWVPRDPSFGATVEHIPPPTVNPAWDRPLSRVLGNGRAAWSGFRSSKGSPATSAAPRPGVTGTEGQEHPMCQEGVS